MNCIFVIQCVFVCFSSEQNSEIQLSIFFSFIFIVINSLLLNNIFPYEHLLSILLSCY
jgi:hypothetical protein